jgi:putative nucleotidyltransferase with HDIG domain
MQLHALRTAAIAGALPLDKKTRDIAVMAALLHDIGRLFLASSMPDKFCSVLAYTSERGCKPFEAEEALLGTSHAEIGAYLLALWGLPNLTVEAIAQHHHPTRIPHFGFDCVAAVYVADLLAHEMDEHPEVSVGLELEESDRACLETLGVLPRLTEFRELALQSHNKGRG